MPWYLLLSIHTVEAPQAGLKIGQLLEGAVKAEDHTK